jgi:hypothetical protein
MNWETDVDFCPEMGKLTIDSMAKTIAEGLFSDEGLVSVLKARYEQMQAKFAEVPCRDYGVPKCGNEAEACLTNVDQNAKPDARLRVDRKLFRLPNGSALSDLFTMPCFGHDMPVWFRNKKKTLDHAKKIMVISQDPKRTENQDKIGAITLSTPFGVHSADYRRHTRNDVVSDFINYLGDSYGIVYLTDARKLYVGTGKVSEMVQGEGNHLRAKFDKLIMEEIGDFAPDLIVTLGGQVIEGRFTDTLLKKVRPQGKNPCVQSICQAGQTYKIIASCHPNPRFMARQEVERRFVNLKNNIDKYFGR